MPRVSASALPTAPLAGLTLVVGFAAGQLTGVRPVAAVVLLAGAAWCALRSVPSAGWWRVAAVVGVAVMAFVGSHLVAPVIGAWPAVVVAALVLAAVTWALVDAPAPRRSGDDGRDGAPSTQARRSS
ncbi:hypothetical protein [Cellulomonas chengniuliangii]|uniref:Tryptophan-associated transmembrane protein (Trp_oprn_chp) n=1 Tax=Cellulomonas chengniuliangii TaxID=2968084 RepID=A0ABY5KV65_9CELL|nr:hypothetical protein [Cellulomonas chengniuliangii]MCC2308916.1 hypothetical protein [Cellulomonas chengniuliangii]UUI74345.1 hypothetical protein NP064_11085 [Cellulomonas chengniuliangii]